MEARAFNILKKDNIHGVILNFGIAKLKIVFENKTIQQIDHDVIKAIPYDDCLKAWEKRTMDEELKDVPYNGGQFLYLFINKNFTRTPMKGWFNCVDDFEIIENEENNTQNDSDEKIESELITEKS